jgi:hypothetical protein
MATTITVEDDTLERFNRLKVELDTNQPDVPNHSSDSFLKCLMDTYDAAQEGHYGEPNDPLTLSKVDEIAEQLQAECECEPVDYAEVENRVEKALERVMR